MANRTDQNINYRQAIPAFIAGFLLGISFLILYISAISAK